LTKFFNRIGEKDGYFYYNLIDEACQSVRIGPGTCDIVPSPEIWLNRKHSLEQSMPDFKNGDIRKLMKYCRISEKQTLLFLVTQVTAFIPDINQPIRHMSGPQGSAKSFTQKLLKRLIDNSSIGESNLPRKGDDIDLLLYRHKVPIIANQSKLSDDLCDRLCVFVEQGSTEKRLMYTDTDSMTLKSNPVIMLNSIGALHSRADLAERTIVFECARISRKDRKEEKKILSAFEEDVPIILGGCFNLLAGAMQKKPFVETELLPRMAEFAAWGYCIAEEMGEGLGEQFLMEFNSTSQLQSEELIERDTLFSAIVDVMAQPSRETLSGSFKEIIMTLSEVAAPGEAKNGYACLEKDKTFPSARGLSNYLERLRIPLEAMKIKFEIERRRTADAKAFVTFSKIENDETTDETTKGTIEDLASTVPF